MPKTTSFTNEFRALIAAWEPNADSGDSREVQQAVLIARTLQQRARELQTPQERRQQAEFDRMMQTPNDKTTLTQLTDQAFRSRRPHRAADQLVHILDVQGIPRFFTSLDRALLKGFQSFGNYLPGVAMPFVKEKMQHETANVILPAERELLVHHLRNRRQEGVRMNVNYLGEALLGEEEAESRLQNYLHALQLDDIEVVSVKISTIYSQIRPIAREHTVQILCDRLELLFRAAGKVTFQHADGSEVPKLVYLDMEEYRDMELTAEAFMRTLDRPGLESATAGIVLQAYVPDSFPMQRRITGWARERVAAGGAPIVLRLVKGANMEMERLEAGLHGWPQAPYKTKIETDANYKRMLRFGMLADNLKAVRLGVASHNLFELAYGLTLAHAANVDHEVQFEMLEGMANHQRRALFEQTDNLLLYAPACDKDKFVNAIGYLVRRLDENTGPDNFLRYAFRLQVDSPDWRRLEQLFRESYAAMDTVSGEPRRTQDRNQPTQPTEPSDRPWQLFHNEPDTDFSLSQNVAWAEDLISTWKPRAGAAAATIPLVIDSQEITADRDQRESVDPSRPGTVVARYHQGTVADAAAAVAAAVVDADGWRSKSASDRREILARAADELRRRRGDLMGAALAEGGKVLTESDPEVSEAVDFARFYGQTAQYFCDLPDVEATGRGVVAVVSPWNFPIAIPCGGVAAALAAGNTVILKPASDTVMVAYEMCRCFWRAGVSRRALQFLPCPGGSVGQYLASHRDVDTVILTGGTATAQSMLRDRPEMRLMAETGGKNATIVTALADRDQAIKNVLESAFGHCGQKCSATSLLILEREVYEDPQFKQNLCDAAESFHVGSAWELHNRLGPMIRPASGHLEQALKELEQGESWALLPHQDSENPYRTTPAVKWGVQPGSVTHLTEFFGPVLGVMCANDLYHAIELVNQTGYGLTSGLESLDDREQAIWVDSIRAGNLYINRGTTGAIVLRQPFGGMGKSAFGPGIKAGGPNYVAQLMRFAETGTSSTRDHNVVDRQLARFSEELAQLIEQDLPPFPAKDLRRVNAAIASYDFYDQQEFSQRHDHFRLIGQDNERRYLPVRELRVRVHRDDSCFDVLARVCAAKAAGCRTTVSFPMEYDEQVITRLDEMTDDWAGAIEVVEESNDMLAEVIRKGHTQRIRYANPQRVPYEIRLMAAETGLYVADMPVLGHGRIELLWYFEEQSISNSYHRYGNLGTRQNEDRASVL